MLCILYLPQPLSQVAKLEEHMKNPEPDFNSDELNHFQAVLKSSLNEALEESGTTPAASEWFAKGNVWSQCKPRRYHLAEPPRTCFMGNPYLRAR